MAESRRILITGLSSHWGGRLAQRLERDPAIEAIVGVDTADPRHELERTEFVHVGLDTTLLRRIIRAARIDTVVDTRLVPDTLQLSAREVHEVNVVGTRSLLAAAAGSDSPVRKLVFKSSSQFYGNDRNDPAFFTEEMSRSHPPRTAVERDVVEAEAAVAVFAQENPDITTTVLRCAPPISGELRTAHLALLGLPVVPTILGFDPRWQFIHEEDVLGVLAHAVAHSLPGAYNAAADGVLALSEVVSLLGKPLLPVLPPWGTVFTAIGLRRLGLRVPVETLLELRHGRGLDNRRLKAAGYAYRYTTREAVLKLRAHQRLRPLLGSGEGSYRYEREVEEFLRRSPSVRAVERLREVTAASARNGAELSGDGTGDGTLASLTEAELLEIIPSLETDALRAVRELEAAGEARSAVLEALDHQLALRGSIPAS